MSRKVYLGTLAGILAVLWAALAFHPFDRSDWWLENALLFAGVALLVATNRVFPLSRVSYTTIFVFFYVTAKIFRVGILSYGKRPTIPELWRWLKVA